MQRPYDLVLFDLDGTLSDPLVGIGRSINYALSHYGYQPLALSQLAVHIGPPVDEACCAPQRAARCRRAVGARLARGA